MNCSSQISKDKTGVLCCQQYIINFLGSLRLCLFTMRDYVGTDITTILCVVLADC